MTQEKLSLKISRLEQQVRSVHDHHNDLLKEHSALKNKKEGLLQEIAEIIESLVTIESRMKDAEDPLRIAILCTEKEVLENAGRAIKLEQAACEEQLPIIGGKLIDAKNKLAELSHELTTAKNIQTQKNKEGRTEQLPSEKAAQVAFKNRKSAFIDELEEAQERKQRVFSVKR